MKTSPVCEVATPIEGAGCAGGFWRGLGFKIDPMEHALSHGDHDPLAW